MKLSIKETMKGTHEFSDEPGEYEFEFNVTWGLDDIKSLAKDLKDRVLRFYLDGTITVGGLCEDVPCEGTLELRYFKDGKIKYDFAFEHDGIFYSYIGEKVNIRPWNLLFSHTTCFGTITEIMSGRLISRSVTHFEAKSVPGFISSFRIGR